MSRVFQTEQGRRPFVNVPVGTAVFDTDRGTITSSIFHESDKYHTTTALPPGIVESIVPICRGGERVIRVRLPRYLTIELPDIFVLDI